MKKLLLLLVVGTLSAVPAMAQFETRGEFFAGYAFDRMDVVDVDLGPIRPGGFNLNGFNLQGGKTLGTNSVTDSISLVFDFGAYYSDIEPFEQTGLDIYTLTAGPQFTNRSHRYLHPFVRALFGVSHVRSEVSAVKGDDTGFAFIAGGGLDIRFKEHFALRLVQLDYLLMRHYSENLNNFRVVTGVVFPF